MTGPTPLSTYCLKPIFAWAPHLQLPQRLFQSIACPNPACGAKGKLRNNSWASGLRSVHDLEQTVYLMAFRYKCKACGHTSVSSSNEFLAVLPEHIMHRFPFSVRKKTAYTRRFIETVLLLSSSSMSIANIYTFFARRRFGRYVRQSHEYLCEQHFFMKGSGVSTSTSRQRSIRQYVRTEDADERKDEEVLSQAVHRNAGEVESFPAFNDHCGYNETLSPSAVELGNYLFCFVLFCFVCLTFSVFLTFSLSSQKLLTHTCMHTYTSQHHCQCM